jgi:hypothetical protein
VMDACVEAAAGDSTELANCESVDTIKETLIEASGNPLVEADEAVELKRQLIAKAFVESQEAANDAAADATASGANADEISKAKEEAQADAKALFNAQTGKDLDDVDMDFTEIKENAMASSIADAVCACVDAGPDCTDADAVISKAANTANGEMPGADEAAKAVGGRRLANAVTAASTKAEKKAAARKVREKKSGALKVIKDRTDACLKVR